MDKIWGFIGCGNLAQSIIEGAVRTGALMPNQIVAADLNSEKLREFAGRLKISAAMDMGELVEMSDVLVLATKPQDILPILEVLEMLSQGDAPATSTSGAPPKKKAIISLAAGVSDKLLLKYLAHFPIVARVMANTPALVQHGFFGIYFAKGDVKAASINEIIDVFKKLGEVAIVKNNKQIDALTSASASGVGFILCFMEEYEKWLKKQGFDSEQTRKMVVEIFLGTAFLAKNRTQFSLQTLREAVTSKKGTTLAGLMAMKKARVGPGLKAGLDAGFKRALEISKDLLRTKK